MKKVTLWCDNCKQEEEKAVQDTCSTCGKHAYTYITTSIMYPQPEDIYESLRSCLRADSITREQLQALKELCEHGLGEKNIAHVFQEKIPFKTVIPENIRKKARRGY